MCRVTASRSPPNAWPTLTVAASHPVSRSVAAERENHAGRAPPSVITYTARGAAPSARAPASDGRQRGVQVGHHDGHPAEVVGLAQQLVLVGLLLVDAEHHRLQRGVAGLDQVAGAVRRVGGQPVRHRHHERVAARAERAVERGGVEQDGVAGPGEPDQRGVGQGAGRALRCRRGR